MSHKMMATMLQTASLLTALYKRQTHINLKHQVFAQYLIKTEACCWKEVMQNKMDIILTPPANHRENNVNAGEELQVGYVAVG